MAVNLKSTKMELNPMIPPPNKRPKCQYCDLPCAIISCLKDGSPNYRKVCQEHHKKRIIEKNGVSSPMELTAKRKGLSVAEYSQQKLEKLAKKRGLTVAEYTRQNLENLAKKKGITVAEYTRQNLEKLAKKNGVTVTAQRRSYHKYRKFMKDYCENRDGSVLPFTCTTTIFPDMGMLEVDHISGNPSDNHPSNFQTLCKCCHAFKTFSKKDYATPGRKALGVR